MLPGDVWLSDVLYIAQSHILLGRKFKQNFGLLAVSHVVLIFLRGQELHKNITRRFCLQIPRRQLQYDTLQ